MTSCGLCLRSAFVVSNAKKNHDICFVCLLCRQVEVAKELTNLIPLDCEH